MCPSPGWRSSLRRVRRYVKAERRPGRSEDQEDLGGAVRLRHGVANRSPVQASARRGEWGDRERPTRISPLRLRIKESRRRTTAAHEPYKSLAQRGRHGERETSDRIEVASEGRRWLCRDHKRRQTPRRRIRASSACRPRGVLHDAWQLSVRAVQRTWTSNDEFFDSLKDDYPDFKAVVRQEEFRGRVSACFRRRLRNRAFVYLRTRTRRSS